MPTAPSSTIASLKFFFARNKNKLSTFATFLASSSKFVLNWSNERTSDRKMWENADRELCRLFTEETALHERFGFLFSYFVLGFIKHRTADLANAEYIGEPSRNGEGADRLEGFSRMLPLIASWIASGREREIVLPDGQRANLVDVAIKGLRAGADPASPGYWGRIRDYDQRICEAADIALSVWLLRDSVWSMLDDSEKQNIIDWLVQVNVRKVPDNNWHLFVVLTNSVVKALGYEADQSVTDLHYSRFKSFYAGDGWFSDGPDRTFDFYNPWGIHYALFWISEVDPTLDRDFIRTVMAEFAGRYKYCISPEGIPITGRSVCYRMAAPAPLIAGAFTGSVSPGLAQRALDVIWIYFIKKGAVAKGNVTQGYFGKDHRFLENYSGPASCLWSVRSLVLAFYAPAASALWTSEQEPLPVESSDYTVDIEPINWRIEGIMDSREIRITRLDSDGKKTAIDTYTRLMKIRDIKKRKPLRPENKDAKYRQREYSSRHPFCGGDD